ncbi:hypothetical protein CC78DRAFT_582551 [Lojkania enalia]|uniref:Uncharacterized protein n=1 Tax=Lojkania enalia TaxID=147567 RepID=A0A9P4N1K1_9PLEO|nr:hypothetical protein CC78DRAFT_582551 [Didymosphaeria enalia]
MPDSPEASRSPEELPNTLNDLDELEVLFLAASLFEFNMAYDKCEGGIPYLVFAPREIFDLIGRSILVDTSLTRTRAQKRKLPTEDAQPKNNHVEIHCLHRYLLPSPANPTMPRELRETSDSTTVKIGSSKSDAGNQGQSLGCQNKTWRRCKASGGRGLKKWRLFFGLELGHKVSTSGTASSLGEVNCYNVLVRARVCIRPGPPPPEIQFEQRRKDIFCIAKDMSQKFIIKAQGARREDNLT